MTIQYASDLHLEFPANKRFLQNQPLIPVGDILILAGDVVLFRGLDQHQDFFNYVSDNFQTTFWLPGNHEYYHSDINERSSKLHEAICSNVFLVNNFSIVHENVRLIFSTMWSKISPEHQWQISHSINDFKVIFNGQSKLTVDEFNRMHEECLSFITNELNTPFEGKSIVVSHHVPTLYQYPEKYKGDKLNDAFAVELSDLIREHGPDYWIFGHHHHNQDAFSIGKTQLLTNQVGYVQNREHRFFALDKTINVGIVKD